MAWDKNADDLKAEVEKYSNASTEALKSGNFEASDLNWDKSLAAFRKLQKYLKDTA